MFLLVARSSLNKEGLRVYILGAGGGKTKETYKLLYILHSISFLLILIISLARTTLQPAAAAAAAAQLLSLHACVRVVLMRKDCQTDDSPQGRGER